MAGGRPTKYTKEIAEAIVKSIQNGDSVVKACEKVGVCNGSFADWKHAHEWLAIAYSAACKERGHYYAEQIMDLADEPPQTFFDKNGSERIDPGHVQWMRNRVDARKWVACKMLPKIYGDKIEHSGQISFTPVAFELPSPKQPQKPKK